MSKASDASNAVVYAAAKILDLYGVRHTREQSRVILVPGAAGRTRPMFFGKWIDDAGITHNSGRADILARPRIGMRAIGNDLLQRAEIPCTVKTMEWFDLRVSIPLWIECKSGKGRLSPDQIAFKNWVEANGDGYLLLHDDVSPLTEWLEIHGVKKEPKKNIHAAPMSEQQVADLPCRHCKEEKRHHTGTIFACVGRLGTLIGKVYSPDLKVKK